MNTVRAVFLDRDGVINTCQSGKYVNSVGDLEFIPGVLHAMRALAALPVHICVASNQGGVGLGFLSEQNLWDVTDYMTRVIVAAGGRVDAVYYCPHDPALGCDCRKPKPGLLLRGLHALGADAANCWMVGDHETDLYAANGAGVKSILVRSGRYAGEGCENGYLDGIVPVVDDLRAAVAFIEAQL